MTETRTLFCLLSQPLLLAGCSIHQPDFDTGDADGSWADGCVALSADEVGLVVETTDVATVPRVRWTFSETADTWLEFRSSGASRSTPMITDTTGEQEQLLLGLTPHSDVDVRVVVDDGHTTWCTERVRTVTGGLDGDLPEYTLTTPLPDDVSQGFLVVPLLGDSCSHVAAFDTRHGIVWATPVDSAVRRARVSLEGATLVVNLDAPDVDVEGSIVELGMDGSTPSSLAIVGAHTDFVETSPHSYVSIAWEPRTLDGRGHDVLADKLVEVSAGGETRELWNAWDALDFDEDVAHQTIFTPGDVEREDWTHANGLSYDVDSDTLVLTLGGEHTVVAIDRATGETLWVLGGPSSTFALEPGVINNPHSAVLQADGNLLVFNRNDLGSGCSEAVEIALDHDAQTAESTWAYQSEECLSVYFLGQAASLPGGNRLVIFSTSGQIDQATTTGETAWRLALDLGTGVGFGMQVPSLY